MLIVQKCFYCAGIINLA